MNTKNTLNKWTILLVTFFAMSVGCASIEGTRNKSLSIFRTITQKDIDSLAITAIKENASLLGLSSAIEISLRNSLTANLPGAKIMDSQTFGECLMESGLLPGFGVWRASYESTAILDSRPLTAFGQAAHVHYLLLVQDVQLSREKIRGVDAGYTGIISDADNVWRTNLKKEESQ